jgi:CRISPR/Cas system-associated endonuclease Cas1
MENEIGEVQIRSGNSVSAGALATLGFWGIDCILMTQRGNPIAVLKSLSDDMHVSTRIAQYEAVKSDKSLEIAKKIVLAKLQGQQEVLKKHGLKFLDYTYFEKQNVPSSISKKYLVCFQKWFVLKEEELSKLTTG